MKIYNAILKKHEYIDISKPISIYLCGPTVYNHVHIGNIRPIITFDVLVRLLMKLGVKVNFIHNITDIDDKIIKESQKLNVGELELSNYFYEKYLLILNSLNITSNINMPKVSEHINGIIEYIDRIIKNNFAYLNDGDVYFETTKVNDYGSLSNKKLEELEIGSRISENEKKKSQYDFVLWKETKEGINWNSPFSTGRPGWHTECSYLISKYIGDQVDIHGGGIDLKFPHHENENAQNIAIHNKPLAKHWIHVGHLNINNEKMSKSLNNFLLAKDLLEEYDSNTIRWFFYQTNYANPINYTKENMDKAKNEINNIINTIQKYKSYLFIEDQYNDNIHFNFIEVLEPLLNDLNLPNTVTEINSIMKKANTDLREKQYESLNLNLNKLLIFLNVLGIHVEDKHDKQTIEDLKKWNQYKLLKDFENADRLRLEFIKKNLV